MKVKNWAEALENIDKFPKFQWPIEVDALRDALYLERYDYMDHDGSVLTKHWVHNWRCTDTWVGLAIYCLNGKPVAVSEHSERKSYEKVYFLDMESAEKTRTYLISIMDTKHNPIPLADIEKDFEPYWFRNTT